MKASFGHGQSSDQKLVPELQPLVTRINAADTAMLITIEPSHPNQFEKNTNT
jgi:hypothetical protein